MKLRGKRLKIAVCTCWRFVLKWNNFGYKCVYKMKLYEIREPCSSVMKLLIEWVFSYNIASIAYFLIWFLRTSRGEPPLPGPRNRKNYFFLQSTVKLLENIFPKFQSKIRSPFQYTAYTMGARRIGILVTQQL